MSDAARCPDAQTLRQLLLGQAPDNQAEALEQHLLHCPRCVETVRTFKEENTLVATVQKGAGAVEVPQGPEVETLVQRMRNLAESATHGLSSTAATLAPQERATVSAGDSDPTMSEFHDCLLPAQATGEIGRLGPYRVLKVLGAGGMGVVFAAEDPQLQRTVALKVMRGAVAKDPACRERFLREARATAAIEHDNIVVVYQVGEDHGMPFLAMPLLQGETLQSRLERERVPPIAEVLRIGREIAAGLAAAHARGLMHRDIKPGNIWLEAGSGRVKIVDFGLARLTQENVQLTKAGYILGTPTYMAPEQAKSEGHVDARCDLYSLGVVLYRMGTGRLPFLQQDLMALLAAVAVDTPIPPRELNPELPSDLGDLVMRLLAKRPSERPESAQVVVEAIQAIERGQTPPALAPAPRPERGRRWLAIAAMLVALLGAAGWFAGPAVYRIVTDKGELIITSDDPDVSVVIKQGGQQVDILDLKTKKQLSLKAGEYEIELSGDGARLRLSTDKFTLTRGGRQIVSVFRVPPAQLVATSEDKKPMLAPKVGEIRTFSGHASVVSSVAFSADGKRAVSGSWDKSVRLWDVDAGTELKRFYGPTKTVRSVALSRDGGRIAAGGGDQLLWLWDVAAGREWRRLSGHGDTITGVAFSADGKRIVSASLDQTVRLWSAGSGKGLGAPLGGLGPVESVAFSPDGRYILSGGQDQLVHLWDADTDKSESWKGHNGVVNSVAFSPEGTRAASGGLDGTVRIWQVPGGKELHRLQNAGEVQSVAFTPDGKHILAGCRDRTLHLWDLASQRDVHVFTGHQGRIWSVAISPDGRRALSGSEDRTVRLWGLPPPP